jgi:hypothetical protein
MGNFGGWGMGGGGMVEILLNNWINSFCYSESRSVIF